MSTLAFTRLKILLARAFRQLIYSQRGRLFNVFTEQFHLAKDNICLDVGGFSEGFETLGEKCCVTVVNREIRSKIQGYDVVLGDARFLPFQTNSVDVVVMISLLEHVSDAKTVANEVKRVCRGGYFVQVPYLFSPVEPHYLFPLFQFVPESIRKFLLFNLKLRIGWMSRKNYHEIKLFTKSRLHTLFPDAQIQFFKVMGIPIELIAFVKR